jgi:hypothetical protein
MFESFESWRLLGSKFLLLLKKFAIEYTTVGSYADGTAIFILIWSEDA